MKVKINQVWKAKGRKAEWTVWNINTEKNEIALTREDILNPGMGGDRYEKRITYKNLLKRYEKVKQNNEVK